MKIRKIFFMALFWPLPTLAQWSITDTSVAVLTGVADIDTAEFLFPTGPPARYVTSDTTRFGNTALQKSEFLRMVEKAEVWIDRINVVGNADSFKIYYKPIHPKRRQLASNDSTFIVGSASTFGNFTNFSRFQITLPPGRGITFILQKGDGASAIRTRVLLTLVYSQ